jgi:hypothetical protein
MVRGARCDCEDQPDYEVEKPSHSGRACDACATTAVCCATVFFHELLTRSSIVNCWPSVQLDTVISIQQIENRTVAEALHAKTSCGGAARCIRHRESGNAMPSTQSVRTAQTSVYSLLGLEKKPPPVYKGNYNLRVLLEAFMALHEIGV